MLAQQPQRLLVEPRAHLACIVQPADVVVEAHKQRAEARARPLRAGVTAHDEFLFADALDLQTIARSAFHTWRISTLANQTFPAVAAGLLKVPPAVLATVFAVTQVPACTKVNDLLQDSLA